MRLKLLILALFPILVVSGQFDNNLGNGKSGFGKFGTGKGFVSTGTAVDYNDYADALFERMTNEPSDSFKYAISRFYDHITTWNPLIYDTLDFLHCYALADTQAAFLDWINEFDANSIGQPTHTPKQGILTADSKYLKLNYNPGTQAINLLKNSCSLGFYSRTQIGGMNQYDIGSADAGGNEFKIMGRYNGLIYYSMNQSTASTYANTVTLGMLCSTRSASDAVHVYVNGNLLETETRASTFVPNISIYLGNMNNNGAPVAGKYSTKQYAFDFGGGLLSQSQIDTLLYAMEEFLDYFGTGVLASVYKGWWTSTDNLLADAYNTTNDTIEAINDDEMEVSDTSDIKVGDYIKLESTVYRITARETGDSVVVLDKTITADVGDTIFTSGISSIRDRASDNHGVQTTAISQPKFNMISDTNAWRFDYSNDFLDISNENVLDNYWGIWYTSVEYGGGKATYPVWVRPMAVYSESQNKTYFVYGNRTNDPTIAYYNHITNRFSDPVEVGENADNDAHKNPSILIDEDGYIYVFHGSHASIPCHVKKSTSVYDISSWTSLPDIPISISYPQPWQLKADSIYMLYRKGGTYPSVEVLIKSGNGGTTWTDPDTIVSFSDPCGIYAISISDTGDYPRKLHLVWSTVYCTEETWQDRKDVWYAYSNDAGLTWKKKDGTPYALPITSDNGERIYTSVGDSGVWLNDIQLDESGEPYILFIAANTTDPLDFSTYDGVLKVTKYSDGEWSTSGITEVDHMYDNGAMVINSSSDIRVYSPTTIVQTDQDGGDIEEWKSVNGGDTWTNTKHITSNSTYSHNNIKTAWNHKTSNMNYFWSYGNSDDALTDRKSYVYYYNGTASPIYNRGWVAEGLNITGDITISMWVKIFSLNTAGLISTVNNANAKDECYAIWIYSNKLKFIRGDGTDWDYADMSPNPPLNDWINIVAVCDGTDLIWYLNGVEAGTGILTITPTDIVKPLLGALKTSSTYYTFNGMINDVKIWDRALTPAEVLTLYQTKQVI